MKYEERIGDKYYAYFPSIVDLSEEKPASMNVSHHQEDVVNIRLGKDWFGVDGGYEETMRTIAHGWPEGLARVRPAFESLDLPVLPVVRRQRRRGSSGDHLDIHRVYAGDLNNAWESTVREPTDTQIYNELTLLVNLGASFGVESDEFMWRGACVAALSDIFQKSGRYTRIVAYAGLNNAYRTGQDAPKHTHMFVEVKRPDQPMSLDVLMAVVGLSGFYRTHMFTAYMALPYKTDSCLGNVLNDIPKNIPFNILSDKVITISNNIESEYSATSFLHKVCKEL